MLIKYSVNSHVLYNMCKQTKPNPYLFFFLTVLKFELRTSHLVGKHCTTWTTTPFFFFGFVFQIVIWLTLTLPGLVLNRHPSVSASWVPWIIGIYHHAWLASETGSCWIFVQTVFEPQSSYLYLPNSWNSPAGPQAMPFRCMFSFYTYRKFLQRKEIGNKENNLFLG
jgi:hypothetical protein